MHPTNADPDALASALALKRIMIHKVHSVDIARINEVTRPDNLAMIRYLKIPKSPGSLKMPTSTPTLQWWIPSRTTARLSRACTLTASSTTIPCPAPPTILRHVHWLARLLLRDIRPNMGATSTMMARYLKALRMRPGPRLATACSTASAQIRRRLSALAAKTIFALSVSAPCG